MAKNYSVEVKEAKGSCAESSLFTKMLENGELNAQPVKDMIGKNVTITGYASCTVTAGDKTFDMVYYATNEGILSSGSNVFLESVKNYIDLADEFKIIDIKTTKGTTFKVTPIVK